MGKPGTFFTPYLEPYLELVDLVGIHIGFYTGNPEVIQVSSL